MTISSRVNYRAAQNPGQGVPGVVLGIADANDVFQPLSPTNPLPTGNSSAQVTLTQTVVALSAGVDAVLVAANASRKYLKVQNIGTDTATLNFGAAATALSGLALSFAGFAGGAGGEFLMDSFVSGQAVHGISVNGTSVVVIEGV